MIGHKNLSVKDELLPVAQPLSSPLIRPTAETNVTNAVQLVYKQYGPDLSAFFRDVQSELRPDDQTQLPLFRAAAAVKRS